MHLSKPRDLRSGSIKQRQRRHLLVIVFLLFLSLNRDHRHKAHRRINQALRGDLRALVVVQFLLLVLFV